MSAIKIMALFCHLCSKRRAVTQVSLLPDWLRLPLNAKRAAKRGPFGTAR
ncbi:hypothetical protein [Pseudomonas cannabina]|uniref:Uncharacterized protein n=1 Tax=Pseudomonas cannabina pv. alisalensis TaxID=757414 RepID=A0ABS1XAI9_PSEC1|nr:hypothetical protein [Pseudomonas cannabina]MBM0138510.1 hypothetical protein [Pseudomonas cannabina pv. alisalensis]